MLFSYQRNSSGCSCRFTPESRLSGEKGTRIVPWAGMGVPGRIWEVLSACAADVKAYCHLPFSIR